jgi:hypothetical protein
MAAGQRIVEDVGWRAQLDVGVDERAAADPCRGQHREVLHQRRSNMPPGFRRGMPEGVRRLRRAIRVVAGPEPPAALEHAHAQAGLGQAAGADAAAEAGTHDDGVIGVLHGTV